jgi:hypothetical protein
VIKAIILGHPQSKNLLARRVFSSKRVEAIKIACGTTVVEGADYRESSDFYPTYASYNSCLFETSVILTVWEHADELIGNDNVLVMHTDVTPHYKPAYTWKKLESDLTLNRPIGITMPVAYKGMYDEWEVTNTANFTPKMDPMRIHAFDHKIHVWEYIKRYDADIYEYGMDVNPKMIYSHQFACNRATFDVLGSKLMDVVCRLRLGDIGFWTPHMFERLIALYLAKHGGEPILTTAFWHYSSSGAFGPGDLSLYGPRGFKHYKTVSRIINNHA